MGLVTSVMSGTLVMLVTLATAFGLVTLVKLKLISLVIGVMSSVTLVMLVRLAFLDCQGRSRSEMGQFTVPIPHVRVVSE